jgi:DNA mismatch endonuclease (patch repair protein)
VFIDGCFWHGCPDHFALPRTNRQYWSAKIERNRRRDAETDELLWEHGWLSLRFWEHESPTAIADRVEAAVRAADPRR